MERINSVLTEQEPEEIVHDAYKDARINQHLRKELGITKMNMILTANSMHSASNWHDWRNQTLL